ncbi:hypothetical protein WJX84_007597 [Apatococcus fuscideae]|uniref:Uncharacterized protein n=1 Tax=Apatococcus fuscideae TaxID=2026836 RepID=A0AAW1S817_9CHLO
MCRTCAARRSRRVKRQVDGCGSRSAGWLYPGQLMIIPELILRSSAPARSCHRDISLIGNYSFSCRGNYP